MVGLVLETCAAESEKNSHRAEFSVGRIPAGEEDKCYETSTAFG